MLCNAKAGSSSLPLIIIFWVKCSLARTFSSSSLSFFFSSSFPSFPSHWSRVCMHSVIVCCQEIQDGRKVTAMGLNTCRERGLSTHGVQNHGNLPYRFQNIIC
ncbi:hypothetical protein LX36DRAFT_55844 [Colletotrichum falcatum]|nr:hypothetical protein LX36DRAFT_55844 [Colletotrichum falcatum]